MIKAGQTFRGKYKDLLSLINKSKLGFRQDDVVELTIETPPSLQDSNPKTGIDYYLDKDMTDTLTHTKPPPPTKPIADNSETDEKLDVCPPWFSRKLSSILKDNALQRVAGNKRDGDLDLKHLYKAYTTGRCFMKKDVISKKQYNVCLIIDCSGSMRGRQAVLASKCAARFIEHFQDKTSLSVILFNAITDVIKYPNKKMDELHIKEMMKQIQNRPRGSYAYGNHDHYAIRRAVEILTPQKGRKIIVMVSDGEPACDDCLCSSDGRAKECYHGSPSNELHTAIKLAEAHNNVVLGLGVQQDVTRFYPKSIAMYEMADMYNNLITLLQKHVKRGGI